MDATLFETSRGPVPVWGRLAAFSPERPALFVVRGAFPIADHWLSIIGRLPQADVALVHLPGMHTPFFARPGIAGFAGAYDEVVGRLFPGRPVNLLGFSMGGLATLSMRHPSLRAQVVCDPPLSTAGLWPLRQRLRLEARKSDEVADWIAAIFGVLPDRIENRDYRPALDGLSIRTRVLLGEDPLEPERPTARIPSLVSAADRAVYAAHPKIQALTVANTGHNVRDALGAVMDSLRLLLGLQA